MATVKPYRGHELWWNSLRMHWKMLWHALLWGVGAQMICFLLAVGLSGKSAWFLISAQTFLVTVISRYLPNPLAELLLRPFAAVVENQEVYQEFSHYHWLYLQTTFFWSLLVFPIVTMGLLAYFRNRAEKQAAPQYIRGTVLQSDREMNAAIRHARKKTDLRIGTIRLPVEAENKSFFVIGSPGRGKTQLIFPIIEQAKRRGKAKGIVFDLKNEFYATFASDHDLLFNPADSRTMRYTLFNDVKSLSDIDFLVNTILVEPKSNADPIWIGGARDILKAIFRWCYLSGNKSNRAIWECMTIQRDVLKDRLAEFSECELAMQYLEDPYSKQTNCFFVEIMVYAGFFEYMSLCDGDEFSIAQWLESGEEWIFISTMPKIREMLKPAINMFISFAINSHLSMPESHDRRVFYFLDEMAALGKLPNIETVPLQLRSRGGSLWSLVQDFSKFDDVYGRSVRNSFVNACGNFVSFGVEDFDTAEAVAKKIGKQQYYENEVSYSFGVGNNRDGESARSAKVYEYVLLPEELMEMKTFNCVVSVNDFGKATTTIPFKLYKPGREGFIPNPAFNMEVILEKYAELKRQEAELAAQKQFVVDETGYLEPESLQDSEPEKPIDEDSRKAMELDIDQY